MATKTVAKYALKVLSPFVPMALGATGIIGIIDGYDAQAVFMGIYVAIFGIILLFYEFCQIVPFERLDEFLKMNIGFMYIPVGRGAYSLMVGVFTLGLKENPSDLSLATGICVAFWGCLLILLGCALPSLFDVKKNYVP